MSRLDSFIRRMTAQRSCLNHAAGLIADVPGPVLELGLGNGRTFDHLREVMPDREIFAYDRQVAAHPDCIPDTDHMIIGELPEALPSVRSRMPLPAAMAHCDVGSGDAEANRRLAATIGPLLDTLMADGGVVLSDQPMDLPGWQALPLPDGVKPGRYHLWRVIRKPG